MLIQGAGHGVTAQQHAATIGPYKVSDRTAGEVAANPMEHYAGQHLGLLLPDGDHRIVSLDPIPVGRLHIDRHRRTGGPLHLHPEHVWMAGRNCSQPAQLVNRRNRGIVEVSVRVPQQIARRRLHEQATLPDPDRRLDRNAIKPGSTSATVPRCPAAASSSKVVHRWPLGHAY